MGVMSTHITYISLCTISVPHMWKVRFVYTPHSRTRFCPPGGKSSHEMHFMRSRSKVHSSLSTCCCSLSTSPLLYEKKPGHRLDVYNDFSHYIFTPSQLAVYLYSKCPRGLLLTLACTIFI